MKYIKYAFVMLALLCANQTFAEPELGKDYKILSTIQPTHKDGKIEVLEFFFYGCSHCFKMHPAISTWAKKLPKDVEFVYVPTIFNNAWEPMARTYYTLEFVGQRGVDRKKFGEIYNSFAMQSMVTRSKQLSQTYTIRGTPSLIIDGKYLISGLGPDESIRVLNALIDKARKERAGKH